MKHNYTPSPVCAGRKNIGLLWHSIVVASVILLGGCATSQTVSDVARISPNFDYVPEQSGAASAKVTIAVIEPKLKTTGASRGAENTPMFRRFTSNMKDDLSEVVIARGYTTRGPFENYDSMVYEDKKSSNLLLTADIRFELDTDGLSLRQEKRPVDLAYFLTLSDTGLRNRLHGEMVLRSHINLVVSESVTREKLWTKSVSSTPVTFTIDHDRFYPAHTSVTFSKLLKDDNRVYNYYAKALSSLYTETLRKAYSYLDPNEMRDVIRAAAELRDKKVYQ